MAGAGPFGVYLHVPFCSVRCHYCAFATWTDRQHLVTRYMRALAQDVGAAVASDRLPAASSVFFGGGTPSLVPPDLLADVLDRIPRAPDAEVTVECNPDTVSAQLLAVYRRAGVNRISLGVQSMEPRVLQSLGRSHDPTNVSAAVRAVAQAGFPTFNLDLIYGGAGESLEDWARTLEAALALGPPHVSAYALTVEPGTPLARQPERHPDPDRQADMYLLATEVLARAGLEPYEISNWARPGHECRHNLLYWAQGDYLGFGAAAHSHRAGRRWWNVHTPDRYVAAVEAGSSTEAAAEELDADQRRREALQLSLRTRAGVPSAALAGLDDLVEAGLVTIERQQARLSPTGRLLANEVSHRLV